MVQGVIMVYCLDVQAGLKILVQNCGIFVRSSIALSELCGARVPCQTFGSPTSQIVFFTNSGVEICAFQYTSLTGDNTVSAK